MDDIDNLENKAKVLWHIMKLIQEEAEQRLIVANLIRERIELFKQAKEIYNHIDTNPFKKVE